MDEHREPGREPRWLSFVIWVLVVASVFFVASVGVIHLAQRVSDAWLLLAG
jgi:hypothetical protein